MDKPYTIIFNESNEAVVTIENKFMDYGITKMIERFKNDGYIIKEATKDEYDEVIRKGNFNPV